MKLPSAKALLFISVGVWVATGALAFWAGHKSAASLLAEANASNNANSKGGSKALSLAQVLAGMKDITGTDKGGPVTLDGLLKSAGKPDAGALARWIAGLSPKDCAAAMAALQALPAGVQRNTILGAVVSAWSKSDPKGFLAAAGTVTSPTARENGVDSALRAMASTDPQGALAWLKNNPGSASNAALQERYASLIAGYATSDPQGALNAVSALPSTTRQDAQLKQQALAGLVNGLSTSGQFTAAVTLFNQFPDAQSRNQALGMLATQWASADPTSAATWVATLTDPQARSTYNIQIAQAWAASDPAAAAAWAVATDAANYDPNNPQAGGGRRGGAGNNLLANTISTWSSDDLDGPAQYLNGLQPSPDKDQAIAAFVRNASLEDPSDTLTWIGTISSPQIAQQTLQQLARTWAQTDPAGLAQYLASGAASPDQMQVLQAAANGGGGRGGFGGGGFQGGGGGFAGGGGYAGGGQGGGGGYAGGGGGYTGGGGGQGGVAVDTSGDTTGATDANGNPVAAGPVYTPGFNNGGGGGGGGQYNGGGGGGGQGGGGGGRRGGGGGRRGGGGGFNGGGGGGGGGGGAATDGNFGG